MKKLLGVLLLILFTFSIYFTISSDVSTESNNSQGYASILPIPPPEPPARRGA